MGFLARIFHGRQYEVDPPQPITIEVRGSAVTESDLSRAIRDGVRQVEQRIATGELRVDTPQWRPRQPTQAQRRDLALMQRFRWSWDEVQQIPEYLRDWLITNPPDDPPTPVPV